MPGASFRTKGVYNPKAFFLHAASLRQAFAHCAKFPTAASRRSLDRVSVPVWPIDLSVRLPVFALVSRYLTNKLIGHRTILRCYDCSELLSLGISPRNHIRYCARFLGSIPILRPGFLCVTHPFATRPRSCLPDPVRLACVKRAASVRSEPESNSHL